MKAEMMIKIFRNMYGSINIEFDETGNCDILKIICNNIKKKSNTFK